MNKTGDSKTVKKSKSFQQVVKAEEAKPTKPAKSSTIVKRSKAI